MNCLAKHLLSSVVLLTALAGCEDTSVEVAEVVDPDPRVVVVETYDVSAFNAALAEGQPTVDVAFYITEGGPTSWSRLESAVLRTQDIFAAVGVQIRVQSALLVTVPDNWQTLEPWVMDPPTHPEYLETDLYAHMNETRGRLSERDEDIVAALISHFPVGGRGVPAANTVHIVTLEEVPISYYEWDGQNWLLEEAPTGALSYPPYALADRLPPRLRGFISLSYTPSYLSGNRSIAHEMGHKLINVSHEGIGVCPSFEVNGDALMLYGNSELIPSGAEGRWHAERLALSPFIYRMVDGAAVFDSVFEDGGIYRDRLYGDKFVDPPCQ